MNPEFKIRIVESKVKLVFYKTVIMYASSGSKDNEGRLNT